MALAVFSSGTANAATTSVGTAEHPDSHSGLHCQDHSAETNGPSNRVNVPDIYCYDPQTSSHVAWHDYCTDSPDQYTSPLGNADFRGPCARHDLCLYAGFPHSTCDGPLYNDLKHNCAQRFGTFNPARYDCYDLAYTYYEVVKHFG